MFIANIKITIGIRSFLYLLVLILSLLSIKDTAAQSDTDAAAIRAIWQAQEKVAYNTGDVEACSDTTVDAIFIPENSPPIVGQSAIRAYCEKGFKAMVFDVDPVIDELVVQGDMAYVVGTWAGRIRPRQGSEWTDFENGTINIYRRQEDGKWKLSRAIWNSNKPVD